MTTPAALHHRQVAANGARFHVVECGTGPLVVLLHGFPECWWAWRYQLPALAEAGFRAVAMDLRGYGDSDKPPRGYDPLTLAADVAGVIRTLGCRDAVMVGQGWGGYVAWAVTAQRPDCVRALCAVAAPHPLRMLQSTYRHPTAPAVSHLLAMQVPWLPERRIRRAD
jgi:pimeloyl-ACP methyl ester carboxylesterase